MKDFEAKAREIAEKVLGDMNDPHGPTKRVYDSVFKLTKKALIEAHDSGLEDVAKLIEQESTGTCGKDYSYAKKPEDICRSLKSSAESK